MPRLRRLMRVERIRALTLSDEIELAKEEIERAQLDHLTELLDWDDESDWALRQGSTVVALSRFLVRDRRSEQALAVLELAEDQAIRGGQMLSVAKLRVVRSSALWRLRRRRESVNALISAIRLLGKQPFMRFILDEGPELQVIVQAALDGSYADVRSFAPLRNRLAKFSHHWAVGEQRPVVSNNERDRSPSPDKSYVTKYLELVAVGLSNKEIARTLGVSASTVNYHLKRIFKELRVDNRVRAVRRGHELGIISSDYPNE